MTRLLARTSPRSRTLPIALAAVLAGSAGAGALYAAAGKTATLTVDGTPRSVDFRGDTVADVLASAGVEVGRHDTLVPAASRRLADGERVALRRGRPLELAVDGERRTVWVTASSVDEALQQVGLTDRAVALSASRSRSIPLRGMSLQVSTPKDIRIVADGRTTARTTTATTVRAALIEAGVHLDGDDRLSHTRTHPPADGLAVRVTRMRTQRSVEPVVLPFAVERRTDPTLLQGRTKVLQPGRAGAARRTVEQVFADGRAVKRTVLGTSPVSAPVTRVVAVGTRPRPAVQALPAASGGHDWAALARCESGGNPGAVSSTGKYRGLYQFSLETWRSVGGSGDPAAASAAEQTRRAAILLARSGRGQWPECGRHL